ncbi:Piwi domain-containing protein [Chytriomyces sp. MP71]|nr:Piwi domain-containing protein [Chytriomyces sp. MP71]
MERQPGWEIPFSACFTFFGECFESKVLGRSERGNCWCFDRPSPNQHSKKGRARADGMLTSEEAKEAERDAERDGSGSSSHPGANNASTIAATNASANSALRLNPLAQEWTPKTLVLDFALELGLKLELETPKVAMRGRSGSTGSIATTSALAQAQTRRGSLITSYNASSAQSLLWHNSPTNLPPPFPSASVNTPQNFPRSNSFGLAQSLSSLTISGGSVPVNHRQHSLSQPPSPTLHFTSAIASLSTASPSFHRPPLHGHNSLPSTSASHTVATFPSTTANTSANSTSNASSATSRAPSPSPLILPATLSPIRPRSPGPGSYGTPIHVLTNFYGLIIPRDLVAWHYEVRVVPETVSKVNRRVVDAFRDLLMASEQYAGGGGTEVAPWLAVYDGQRNLYSPYRLPFVNDEIATQVALVDEDAGRRRIQKFGIRIRKLAEIQMEKLNLYNVGQSTEMPKDTIHVLEVLLRQRPASIFTTIGRGGGSFYSEVHNTPIANALTVHQGWYQSIKPSLGQIKLNLDVSATSFYVSGPLLDTVAKFYNRPNIDSARPHFADPHERKRLERFLRDVTIEIGYRATGRKRYKIKGLFDKPCAQTLIVTGTAPGANDGRGKQIMPITLYFEEKYGVHLMHPWLPCVVCGPKNDVILPMEVCFVRRNQRHIGKLNDQQLADIVKLTAVMPEYRKERVLDGMRQLHGTGGAGDAVLHNWGVHIQPEMAVIEGRILAPPPLTFGPGHNPATDWRQVITPTDGTWRIGRNLRFASPATLSTWAVAVFGDPGNFPMHTVSLFVKNIMTACVGLGMEVVERSIPDLIVYAPMPAHGVRMASETIEATLRLANDRALRAATMQPPPQSHYGEVFGWSEFEDVGGPVGFGGMVGSAGGPQVAQMVICILAQKNTVYEQVKKIAETDIGLMTQCVIGKHVHTTKPSYSQNLALKINAKLGGVNSFIDPVHELGGLGGNNVPTIIMGADVTHPQYSSADPSSIAAVVGTVDPRFCEYRSAVRLQNTRREIIQDLQGMTCELFELFRARNGCYPMKILFYRDGVSENQLGDVVAEEVSAVKRACVSLGIGEARLTFAVVNKRHHARFFPLRMEAGESDLKGNILAGTVVDSGVTHPFEFDFYLTSHPGMQGTSKAAHYHVLYDNNNFDADTLQEITYRLCYNFARSTRAVSIVPPAYYAHLVAARARCYASAQNHSRNGAWQASVCGASPSLDSFPMSWGGITSTGHPATPASQPMGPTRSYSNSSLMGVSQGLEVQALATGAGGFTSPALSNSGLYQNNRFSSSMGSVSSSSSYLSNYGQRNSGRVRDLPQVSPHLQGTMFFT